MTNMPYYLLSEILKKRSIKCEDIKVNGGGKKISATEIFKIHQDLSQTEYTTWQFYATKSFQLVSLPTMIIANYLYRVAGLNNSAAFIKTVFHALKKDPDIYNDIKGSSQAYITNTLWWSNAITMWHSSVATFTQIIRIGYNPTKNALLGTLLFGLIVGSITYLQNLVLLGKTAFDILASALSTAGNTTLSAYGLAKLMTEYRSNKAHSQTDPSGSLDHLNGFTKREVYEIREEFISWYSTLWARTGDMEDDHVAALADMFKNGYSQEDIENQNPANSLSPSEPINITSSNNATHSYYSRTY